MNIDKIIIEIENVHNQSNQFLQKKAMKEYLDIFSNELQYKQCNGKIVDKKQIIKDTIKYFQRITKVENSYERVSSNFENDIFIENLIQNSKIEIKVFLFFKKKWNITREGIYQWKKINGNWKIINVEVMKETVT